MLDKDAATIQARQLLETRKAELVVLDRIRAYWRGKQTLPVVPQAVPLEVRKMATMSRINIIGLVVSVHAQALAVTGYRAEGTGEDAPQWAIWQANKLDARQSGVHRAALGYGAAYTVIMPGEPTSVIRGVSPRQLTAVYGTDPDWPVYALESGRVLGGEWRLYDDEAVYAFRPKDRKAKTPELEFVSASAHGMGVCPVVRFLNIIDVDDEDEVQGEVAPLMSLQDQLDFTTFDLLVGQHYAAFRQRYIIGWLAKSEEEKLKTSASRLWTFEDPPDGPGGVKVGEFGQTDLKGYLDSRLSSVHLAGMVSQTPPQDLVSDMVNLSADAIAAAEAGANRMNGDRETSFGESWEQTLGIAGQRQGIEATDGAQVRWRDSEARSLASTVDALGKLAEMLNVPAEMLWERIPGWTQQDTDRAKALIKEADSIGNLAALLDRTMGTGGSGGGTGAAGGGAGT